MFVSPTGSRLFTRGLGQCTILLFSGSTNLFHVLSIIQSPSQPTGVNTLLAKIHICVSQLEQLPVRLADLPGRRGSQALQFFNTHHIKCVLERHSSAVGGAQWKGGALRIDPLATIQVLQFIPKCSVPHSLSVDPGAVHDGEGVWASQWKEVRGARVSGNCVCESVSRCQFIGQRMGTWERACSQSLGLDRVERG